jgi:hypothetical protein
MLELLPRPEFLIDRLQTLRALQSRETIGRWQGFVVAGQWPTLVGELLEWHYDPLYHRSQSHHFGPTAADRKPPGTSARHRAETVIYSPG